MELIDLKKIWKKQQVIPEMDYSRTELMVLINNKMVSLENEIKSRDRREIIAIIIVIVFYGIIFLTTQSIWKQAGSIIIILSGIFIWYKLKSTQRKIKDEEPTPNQSMIEYLNHEMRSVLSQRKLLKNVAWWYLLPLETGLLLFTVGFELGITLKIIFMFVFILTGWGIWELNRHAVRHRLDPLLIEIKDAIRFLEEDEKPVT